MKRTKLGLVLSLVFALSWSVAMAAGKVDFLPVDQAFAHSVEQGEGLITISWDIAPGYYLYQSRIELSAPDGELGFEALRFAQPGEEKNDPYFGTQRVFHDQARVEAAYQVLATEGVAGGVADVRLTYQGCTEAGLCYPPQHRTLSVRLPDPDSPGAGEPGQAATGQPLPEEPDSGTIASFISNASLPVILGTFFLLGIGLTFTPCVLPMVPILSSIIVGQKQPVSTARGLSLSTAYVLGMATTYTVIGVLVGYLGARANIQAWMQQPAVLSVFVVLFLLLGLSMFGLFELQLPASLRDRLNQVSDRQSGGQWLSVGAMGAISALVVSPCVTAPLAGTLLYISATGDAVLGGASLFALAIGMGAPLILVGISGARILPKAGIWMEKVKQFFGVVLFGVAIWLLERILPSAITLALWAALLIFTALHLGALRRAESGLQRFGQALGLMALLWGSFVLFAAASGQGSLFSPLLALTQQSGTGSTGESRESLFEITRHPDVLQAALGDGEPVIVDIYADWCISCKIMEEEIFNQPETQQLAGQYRFIKLDITDFNDDHKAYLEKLRLAGPPAILFFDAKGKERVQARISGEAGLPAFLEATTETRKQAG